MKRLITVIFLLVAMCAAWALHGSAYLKMEYWTGVVRQQPVLAPCLFILVYAVGVSVLLPCLPLNLAAGALWGPVKGSVFALCGSALGAVIAFLLARGALGQPLARKFGHTYVARLQEEFERHGWKVIAFVRLNPIFPGPVNYVFGLTGIRFSTYCWASVLFLAPPTVAFSILGDTIGTLAATGSTQNLRGTILLVGIALTFLAGGVMFARSRQFLNSKRIAEK